MFIIRGHTHINLDYQIIGGLPNKRRGLRKIFEKPLGRGRKVFKMNRCSENNLN